MIRSKNNFSPLIVLVITISLTEPLTALEKPVFELIDEIGEVQIRRYQPSLIARTLVDGSFSEVGSQGFKRLAGYIFGGNAQDQKIAMTAPVGMTLQGGLQEDKKYWITFSMPRKHTMEDLPRPNDSRVEIIQEPEKYMAVVKYKGNWSEERYRQHESKLLLLIEQSSSWDTLGEVTWARYNPPFVPSFIRTNEVAIQVVPALQGY
jgi:hypothetical protein